MKIAAMLLFGLLLMATVIALRVSNYGECRDRGFSRAYCVLR